MKNEKRPRERESDKEGASEEVGEREGGSIGESQPPGKYKMSVYIRSKIQDEGSRMWDEGSKMWDVVSGILDLG